MEQVQFDFTEDGGVPAINRLEGILCSGSFQRGGLHYRDERTILLLRLLAQNGLGIYEYRYETGKRYAPETQARAKSFMSLMGKRGVSESVLEAAERFAAKEPDTGRTHRNAPFFPEMKAFVRCGDLSPELLFELLEYEDCDAVIVFPEYLLPDVGAAFYAIARHMPREDFLAALQAARDEILAQMHEVARKIEEQHNIFPPVPKSESEGE